VRAVKNVAALFVEKNGIYAGKKHVDLWTLTRDARKYAGPSPVVAHPPCASWCMLANLRESMYGLKAGEDGGCFASALAAVRKYGGVLEHPAFSKAFAAHGLVAPKRGGWYRADFLGGWACEVDQSRYGHAARKRTWLYAFRTNLPSLDWREGASTKVFTAATAQKNKKRRHDAENDARRFLSKNEMKATPAAFAVELLKIARSVAP